MATLYTDEQRQDILRQLRILPIEGKITGREAARILTWRAKEELSIEHEYADASLRRHVAEKNLHADKKSRKHRYDVGEVFLLTLSPRRGRQKQAVQQPSN